MDIISTIKNWIIAKAGGHRLGESPFSERKMFINNDENTHRMLIRMYKAFYSGDSDEIQNFFLDAMVKDFNIDPIYTRNKREYFWSIATNEGGFKKVHSGIPRAIIDTLVNVIGNFDLSCDNEEYQKILDNEFSMNKMTQLINTREEPLTMVCGKGGFKISIIPNVNHLIIQYYDGEDVEFAYRNDQLVGAIYKDYYTGDKDKTYTLVEKRSVDRTESIPKSAIEYQLFDTSRGGEGIEVPLDTLEQTAGLKNIYLVGIDEPIAEPCIFFDDPLNPHMGRSMYQGKCDLFDDLDQSLSISSKTSKLSTPIDYIPTECLEVTKSGIPIRPNSYNRDYILINTPRSATGDVNAGAGKIQTTQAQLNFEQYDNEQKSKLNMILTGIMSPCSLGVDLKSRDNSDAQREKEKVTIMTRDNIISSQRDIITNVARHIIILYKFIHSHNGKINISDMPNITIKYKEFANPSFENRLSTLGSAWKNGMISTDIYVDFLWGDTLPKEEKRKEIDRLNIEKMQDTGNKQINPSDINRNWQSESPSYHNDDKKAI